VISHSLRGWLAVVLTLALTLTLSAEDWPRYRGPTGMGTSTDTDLPLTWGGKENANVLWKVPLPGTNAKGSKPDNNQSSPIVWKDRVFVTTSYWPEGRAQTEYPEHHVTCYRLSDGKQLWDREVPVGPWKLADLRGGYTAPTPCTDGDRVYVVFGSSTMAALDFDGKIVWQKDIPDWKDFDVAIASSPVLHNGQLILLADRNGKKGTLTAFDPKTGRQLWEQKRTTAFSHTTPVFVSHTGKTLMLVGAAGELQALDPATGERLWWVKTPGDVTSPVYANGFVFTDSGRGGPGVFVDATGKGDTTATNVKWTLKNIPEGLSSPVIVGDHIYRAHNPGLLKCIELKTGKVVYEQRLEGASTAASPVVAKDRIYLASAGKTVVVAAGEKFEVLAINDLGEPNSASVAVSQGRIVLKGTRNLFCVGAK
jgi:outer membrane protein assembly factor BamB